MATERTNTATMWKAISASDDPIEPRPVALYIGGAGNITIEGSDGHSEEFAVLAGQHLNAQPIRMTAATATGIRALYNPL